MCAMESLTNVEIAKYVAEQKKQAVTDNKTKQPINNLHGYLLSIELSIKAIKITKGKYLHLNT